MLYHLKSGVLINHFFEVIYVNCLYVYKFLSSDRNFESDDEGESIIISDDDLPKISKKSKPSSAKKKRGITFDSDSDDDLLPTKRKR